MSSDLYVTNIEVKLFDTAIDEWRVVDGVTGFTVHTMEHVDLSNIGRVQLNAELGCDAESEEQ